MSINHTHTAETTIVSSKEQIITGNSQTVFGGASDISAFQQVLLTANGTVTAMLEAHFSEQIQIIKLSEERTKKELDLPNIKLNKEEEIIRRKVLLQGKISGRNYIYADSFLLINNLEERFRDQLLKTDKPIGKLWSEYKVETFKEIIYLGQHPANELSDYFCIEPEENLFSRTYSVYSQGKINMIITEKFPERCSW